MALCMVLMGVLQVLPLTKAPRLSHLLFCSFEQEDTVSSLAPLLTQTERQEAATLQNSRLQFAAHTVIHTLFV